MRKIIIGIIYLLFSVSTVYAQWGKPADLMARYGFYSHQHIGQFRMYAVTASDTVWSVHNRLGKTLASLDSLGKLTADSLKVNGAGYFGGNVGIGTTNPGARLDVKPSAAGYNVLFKDEAGGEAIKFYTATAGNEVQLKYSTILRALISSNGITFFQGGSVGIMTANPVNNSLTLGDAVGVANLVITRENTPANSDSSFKATIVSGYPSLIGYGGDGSTSNITWGVGDLLNHAGAASYGFDAPIKMTGKYIKFALNATLPDTTGFVGGETWYSAIGDTTYIYMSNHLIRKQP